jgi:hypothetical protein
VGEEFGGGYVLIGEAVVHGVILSEKIGEGKRECINI